MCLKYKVSKGFIKSILSFFGTIAAIVISFLLFKRFAVFLDEKFNMLLKLSTTVEGFLLKNSKFAIEISAENIEASLSAAGVPRFMAAIILKLPVVTQNAYPEGTTLASLAAPLLANYLLLLISFLMLFIIIKIILILLNRFADAIKGIKIVDTVDKILGFFVGAIEGLILIYIIFTILSIFPSFFAKPLGMVKQSTVANYLYESDLLGKAFDKMIDKDKLNDNITDFINDKNSPKEENFQIDGYFFR